MNRLQWIVKEIYKDLKRNGLTILKWTGYSLLVVVLIKALLTMGMEKKYLYLLTWAAFVIGMTYSWYSMDYDREQKSIIRKLKGKK